MLCHLLEREKRVRVWASRYFLLNYAGSLMANVVHNASGWETRYFLLNYAHFHRSCDVKTFAKFTRYFLLNYAWGRYTGALLLVLATSSLFSFELCLGRVAQAVWGPPYCCHSLFSFELCVKLLGRSGEPQVRVSLFSFELCPTHNTPGASLVHVKSRYFLLNYAWRQLARRLTSWLKWPTTRYFLLNYAVSKGQ